MQRRDEHDLVSLLEHVVALALKLPVRVIHEHKYTRPPGNTPPSDATHTFVSRRGYAHGVALDEQLRPLREQVVAQPVYEIRNVRGASRRRRQHINLFAIAG